MLEIDFKKFLTYQDEAENLIKQLREKHGIAGVILFFIGGYRVSDGVPVKEIRIENKDNQTNSDEIPEYVKWVFWAEMANALLFLW